MSSSTRKCRCRTGRRLLVETNDELDKCERPEDERGREQCDPVSAATVHTHGEDHHHKESHGCELVHEPEERRSARDHADEYPKGAHYLQRPDALIGALRET